MSSLVLIALIVFAAATLGGLAVAAVQGLGAWRAFRGLRRRADTLLTDLAVKIAGIEKRAAAAEARAAELDRARAQLESSLASASVLSEAAGEAFRFFRRVRAALPSK